VVVGKVAPDVVLVPAFELFAVALPHAAARSTIATTTTTLGAT
jgi:hypothetical protein